MKFTAIVAVLLLSSCAAAPALAQPKKAARPSVTTTQAQQNPFQILQNFTQTDLQAALADAAANNDPVAVACYTALLGLVKNPNTNPLGVPSGAFSALQKARDLKALLLNLQSPNGPLSNLNVACAPLILDAQTTLIQLGVMGGLVVGKVALPFIP